MTLAAVVLGGGGGRRFGGPTHKLLAATSSGSVIERALAPLSELVGAVFAEVIVVAGAQDLSDVTPRWCRVVHNADWERGLATSLRVGIDLASDGGHEAVVVGLCDMIGVPALTWQQVAQADSDLAIASYPDGRSAPPVRLGASVWGELPTDGDYGARLLIDRFPSRALRVSVSGSADDIDTLADLQEW